MISRIRQHYFTLRYIYDNPIDRQRARLLLIINWAIVTALLIWMAFLIIPRIIQEAPVDFLSVGSGLVVLAAGYFNYRFLQRGQLRYAIWLFMGTITILITQLVLVWTEFGPNFIPSPGITLVVPLVAGGILLNRRGTILIAVILGAAAIIADSTQAIALTDLPFTPAKLIPIDSVTTVITLGLVLAFLLGFVGSLERTAQESLAENQQREWIALFSAELSRVEGEEPVLSRAVNLISERLGYLLTRIYIADEDGTLSRSIRSGQGQQAVAESAHIRLGDTNLLSEVARIQQPATVTSQDILARRSHLLASASTGAALPIVNNGKLLGVLDIQAAGSNGFSESQIRLLSLLASEIAIAVAYTTSITQLRRGLREQESATGRLQLQLQEFRQRERHASSNAWGQYIEGRGTHAIGFDLEVDEGINLMSANDLPQTIYTTLRSGKVDVKTVGDEQVINVPITFRNTTLGAMSFTIPRDQNVSEHQVEMAQIVAERLALALENTRLFEQSQAQAIRERKASEISSILIGATDVRALLNLAAEQFNEALGAVHTRIYIQPEFMAEPLARTEKEKEEAR